MGLKEATPRLNLATCYCNAWPTGWHVSSDALMIKVKVTTSLSF
jgi:hypothetical protein